MRSFFMCSALIGLMACQPTVPNSVVIDGPLPDRGQGVGFDNNVNDPTTRQAILDRQAALLRSAPVTDGDAIVGATGAAGPTTGLGDNTTTTRDPDRLRAQAELDAAAQAANSGEAVVNASPSNAAPPILNNPGISSEQDFDAVSARRTIEDDAALIASNRAQRQVVTPTELPTRRGAAQPNIVAYALQTSHAVGTQMHRRSGLVNENRFQRNCAAFATSDQAQIAFLENGGPARDRKGLDPDGDGYACNWNPAPFRRIDG